MLSTTEALAKELAAIRGGPDAADDETARCGGAPES